MVFVKTREGETIEDVLRRFKRDVLRSGIVKEVRRRQEHTPPSVLKKLKQKEAERKLRRKLNRSR
ncbi:MAG: 30S ribosomal protein S21 [Elusimicrobia bacterium]|nr:MAG: 30S ribosomal protein S21 [Elusimicrobiota bacterium]